MASDRSRGPDRTRFGYTGVVAQQGRVILDRDFNAQQILTADRIAEDALDFVGPCGTPDDGFRISLIDPSQPAPNYWKPPVTFTASPPETPGQSSDFLIAPGTMYVGGQRVYFPPKQGGAAITYSYLDQPDWPLPHRPSSPPPGIELVYLSLEEQEVSAVEDPDLLEVALGGPDTTQRLKLLRRIHRLGVSSADCASAWQTAMDDWAKEGLTFDPLTMRLMPNLSLKVGFANSVSNTDPCDPVATGGYLGNDNQLIRVRIDRSSGQPRVLWGYDDASFLYRVVNVGSDNETLTLAADPPDAFHFPKQGQWVEVLTTAAVLAQEPDESDPSGQTQILRVAAASDGVLRQAKQAYGPLPGDTQNVLVVTPKLHNDITNSPLPVFVRVWQAAQAIPANGQVTLATTTTDLSTGTTTTVSTGVTATFSAASGVDFASGLFWQIAVRPATPQGVYPEDLLIAPQPSDGPRRWVCPLAVIDWSNSNGPTVTDCRNKFDNLVTLSRRRPGCCTISLGPDDLTGTTTLQMLIDRAVKLAAAETMGEAAFVTVCLSPGRYLLPGTLYLGRQHSNLTLESCGGLAVLMAQALADLSPFADGLLVLDGAGGVTLRGLELRPPIVTATKKFYEDLLARLRKDGFSAAAQILKQPYTSFGVRALNAQSLTLDSCNVGLVNPRAVNTAAKGLAPPPPPADFFAAAVFLQGDCTGLQITNCTVVSDFTPTYTPVSANADVASPAALEKFNRLLAFHLAVPASPPGSSPPSGSPPVSETVLVDQRVSDALDLLVAKRLAGDLTSAGFTVVTTGVLASPSFDGYCALGESTIRASEFDGFTFGAWISAIMSILRLQDNTINNGVAGLWLEAPDAGDPPGAAGSKPPYYKTMLLFEEYQLLVALAAAFPPPTPPTPPHLRSLTPAAIQTVTDIIRDLPPYSLLLTGNQIEVRQQTETVGASAAMRLALYREGVVQPLTSVIVSSNRLCGGMHSGALLGSFEPGSPAALMTMIGGTPCSIAGNVVINRGAGPTPPAPSLWLVLSDSVDFTDQLAVTGNVLRGDSDLAQIRRRGGVPPFDTWSPFNANPA